MHFGEYELFPGLIGLSPLPTVHPNTFQRELVRSSIACYRNFNLTMGRSPGFASAHTDYRRPVKTRFRLGSGSEILNLAGMEQLVGSLCKRHGVTDKSAPPVCRRTVSGTISLPC